MKVIQVGKFFSFNAQNDTKVVYDSSSNGRLFRIVGKGGLTLRGTISPYENIALKLPITVFDVKVKDSITQRLGSHYDSTIVFFSDNVVRDVKENIFSKEYYLYEIISNAKGRLIQPKVIGKGFSGLVLPFKSSNEKLTIYGENLDSTQHQIAMAIFRSTKFLPYKVNKLKTVE